MSEYTVNTEWEVDDVTYINDWREEQITKQLIPIQ